MSQHQFQTEVNQLLHLIIHSLYSHKEIFLRELISNASDALDKLKYLAFTEETYRTINFDPRIDIHFDQSEKTLTVTDTGIGMNEADLVENLGTIARSGTRHFVENISGDAKKDINLIGQFGVGFYSSFMVAGKVVITTRKAGEDRGYVWTSDGKGQYQIDEVDVQSHGTSVKLLLNDEGVEFANRWTIERIIKKYSNHVPFPIYLHYEETKHEGEGKNKTETKEEKTEKINEASAMWKRLKTELTEEDYNEFYKVISHDSEDPLLHVHSQAEGTLEYSTLFYVPKHAPMDMYFSDYRPGVKLYVKRVFITDDARELMPTYLRFLRGIIDSEDLPLNVSREILQHNRILDKIRSTSVKKVLSEFQKLAGSGEKYQEFYREYGKPLKEGLYQDFENRDILIELVRFKSTAVEGYTSLAEYAGRMKPDINAIYYITGESEQNIRKSPLLEMYRDRGIEVLIMDDEIDDIVIPSVGKYRDHDFKSVNRSDAAEDLKSEKDKIDEKAMEPVIKRIKDALGDRVKDVKASTRLSDSPSCIVVDEKDPTVQMQSILKSMGKMDLSHIRPILEINPHHSIIKKLQDISDERLFTDASLLLFEQAQLLEGIKLESPSEFARRLNDVMARAL